MPLHPARFSARAEGQPGGHQQRFADELREGQFAEIIEVKGSLNRPVIGQVLAGIDMFERQYGVAGRPVVVCGSSDSALEWVCRERSIKVATF